MLGVHNHVLSGHWSVRKIRKLWGWAKKNYDRVSKLRNCNQVSDLFKQNGELQRRWLKIFQSYEISRSVQTNGSKMLVATTWKKQVRIPSTLQFREVWMQLTEHQTAGVRRTRPMTGPSSCYFHIMHITCRGSCDDVYRSLGWIHVYFKGIVNHKPDE